MPILLCLEKGFKNKKKSLFTTSYFLLNMNFLKKVIHSITGSQSNNNEVVVKNLNIPSKYLERGVKVDVFLPPQYGNDKKQRYPVVYFNDGQDMLALRMFETLSRLYTDGTSRDNREGVLGYTIVVAMYCNENRINEYGTARQSDYKNRGNKARSYNNFVVHELIPYIQGEFQCTTQAENTTIAGFSLGALSALDIGWANPLLFGKIGVFSGSLWWRAKEWTAQDPDGGRIMHDIIAKSTHQEGMKFWFQVGTKDEDCDRNNNGIIDAIDDTRDLMDELFKIGYKPHEDVKYLEVEGGEHNPQTWGAVMPQFLMWAVGKL
jgi:iron(III)-enterobactin esterase